MRLADFSTLTFAFLTLLLPIAAQQPDVTRDRAESAALKRQIQAERAQLEADKAQLLAADKELMRANDRFGHHSPQAAAAREKYLQMRAKVEADRAKLHQDEGTATGLLTDESKDVNGVNEANRQTPRSKKPTAPVKPKPGANKKP